jgi:lipopolysaccharide biosynthesis glycosyltransferase
MRRHAEAAGERGRAPPRIRTLFCCDPGYYQHLAVAISSLLANNRNNFVEIHLISETRDAEAEAKLAASLSRYSQFSFELHQFAWADKHQWPTWDHITAEAYTRIFCPEILDRSIDRILYLDADLVVVDDLRPLWETSLDGVAVAAAPDPFGHVRKGALGMPPEAVYVNSGVLLLNLDHWRAEGVTARLADYIRRHGPNLRFHDQDAINAILHARTRLLDLRWNLQVRLIGARRNEALDRAAIRRAARSPAIIHYASNRKPWVYVAAMPRKRIYRRYLATTAWRGAPARGKSLRATPEHLVNAALCALGVDASWDETQAGKALHWWSLRLGQELAGLRRRLAAKGAVPVK